MLKLAKTFFRSEDAAVTVDWVILTAAVVGLAVGIYGALEQNVFNLGNLAADAVGSEDDFS